MLYKLCQSLIRVLFVCLVASCNSDPRTNHFQAKPKAKRVLGLSPAITEMLFVVVPDSQILAVTSRCNYPEGRVKEKPRVEVYPLDFEKVASLRPDVVFAEEGITNPQDITHLKELGMNVVVFQYRQTTDILKAMDSIVKIVDADERAVAEIKKLRNELNNQKTKYKDLTNENRPSVLAITWMDPIFAYGYETWMSDKIWLAGGKNSLNQKLDKPYPIIQREYILKMDPDVIFGGTFEKMDTSFFRMYPELKKTKAYKNRTIFELNDDLASRPGPRFMSGIQEIENYIQKK